MYNHIQKWTILYNLEQPCKALLSLVQPCTRTAMYNIVQPCTTLYNHVQQCTWLYNLVLLCTRLYNLEQSLRKLKHYITSLFCGLIIIKFLCIFEPSLKESKRAIGVPERNLEVFGVQNVIHLHHWSLWVTFRHLFKPEKFIHTLNLWYEWIKQIWAC